VSEYRSVLERAASNFAPLDLPLERVERGRERRRRNQRIAAGLVGIAVFVAAVWIVTSGLSLDRSEKSVAPAGEVTGPAETGPPPARASAAPDVVSQGECSGGARSRLELTRLGGRFKARFEVHRSPVGHLWGIHFRYLGAFHTINSRVFPRVTRVASDSGDLVVQRRIRDKDWDWVMARAVDTQTGQRCRADARFPA
jgi:hypothetical protein